MNKENLDAIATREAHCKPYGAAVTLSIGERDELVAMARLAFDQLDTVDEGESQDWANTYPAVAWHLIYRHGENWAHTGVLMERWARAWVAANPEKEACNCAACRPYSVEMRMILCSQCGNKRCPHATDHRHACTGSNEAGQAGSAYA